jgi:hypothetical protein
MTTCGAPSQDAPIAAKASEVVLAGVLTYAGTPLGGAYVRLLDATGEFVAEVVSAVNGGFRFYLTPGQWTVRALHRFGTGQAIVTLDGPKTHVVAVSIE